MKILTVGLDQSILDENSPVARRFKQYGELVDRYDVVVPGFPSRVVAISDRANVFVVGGKSKAGKLFQLALATRRLLKGGIYDLVSTRDPYFLGLMVLILAKIYRVGLEIQIHGFEKFTFWRCLIARWVLVRADGIRVVSERLKKELIADFNLPAEVITVSSIFIDCQPGQKVAHDHFTFITASRLVPIKRVDRQIRVMGELIKKYPDLKLIILGAGPERQNLEILTTKLGLTQNITFVGQVADVRLFLAKADCFVLTSEREGYGLAPIEAACFGLPVIMTNVGCAGEVIINSENGLVVPVNDQTALIKAMTEIIENQTLREKITSHNANLCQRLPTLAENLDRYKQSWTAIMVRRRASSRD